MRTDLEELGVGPYAPEDGGKTGFEVGESVDSGLFWGCRRDGLRAVEEVLDPPQTDFKERNGRQCCIVQRVLHVGDFQHASGP